MKHFRLIDNLIVVISVIFLFNSCLISEIDDNKISGVVRLKLYYPDNLTIPIEGIEVIFQDLSTGTIYRGLSNENGIVEQKMSLGRYVASVEKTFPGKSGILNILNGRSESFLLVESGDNILDVALELKYSTSSQIIFKEIYYGGCFNNETNKAYTKDQYFILYNNSDDIAYLDSLCIGLVDPYNAPVNGMVSDWVKPGTNELRDSIPAANIAWMFEGDGKQIKLNPGEEIVVCLNAIDHSQILINSVNLSKPGYYALYDPILTPGQSLPNIGVNRLKGFWKVGTSTNYVFSTISPAIFLYTLGGKTINDFVADTYTRHPAYSSYRNFDCLMIPKSNILDGVECFRNSTDSKRLPSEIDNGFASILSSGRGYSIHRKKDLERSSLNGTIKFMDTNNSTNDFEMREIVSLKNESLL